MPLGIPWAITAGETSPEAVWRALKRLENVLGRTAQYGSTRTTTSATTLMDSDDLLLVNTTGGNITVTLPLVASNLGRRFAVKKIAAGNTLTLDGNGSEQIDGAATLAWTTNNLTHVVQSDGTMWRVIV